MYQSSSPLQSGYKGLAPAIVGIAATFYSMPVQQPAYGGPLDDQAQILQYDAVSGEDAYLAQSSNDLEHRLEEDITRRLNEYDAGIYVVVTAPGGSAVAPGQRFSGPIVPDVSTGGYEEVKPGVYKVPTLGFTHRGERILGLYVPHPNGNPADDGLYVIEGLNPQMERYVIAHEQTHHLRQHRQGSEWQTSQNEFLVDLETASKLGYYPFEDGSLLSGMFPREPMYQGTVSNYNA